MVHTGTVFPSFVKLDDKLSGSEDSLLALYESWPSLATVSPYQRARAFLRNTYLWIGVCYWILRSKAGCEDLKCGFLMKLTKNSYD